MKHQTYIINLEHRIDRRNHIINEFGKFPEFEFEIFPANIETSGALGLFKSFRAIVKQANANDLDYVVICEDDHVFTNDYNADILNNYIKLGIKSNMEVLLGGPSNIHDHIFVNDDLIWLNSFTGLQFTIIFRPFYQKIINYDLPKDKVFDLELGNLSNNIYTLYPPFSEQVSFGYSDITEKNNFTDIALYFKQCKKKMDFFYLLSQYYNQLLDQ